MYRFGSSWLWSWGLDGDTVRSAGLGDVVQGTDCCPASATAQLEQVAHFSECPFSRFYLQNRNKKFYLVEFLRDLTELTYDNLFLRDSEMHVKK